MKAVWFVVGFALVMALATNANAATLVSQNEKENLSLLIEQSGETVRLQVCNRAATRCRQLGSRLDYSKTELKQTLRHYKLVGLYPSLVAFGGSAVAMFAAVATGGAAAPLIIFPAALGIASVENNASYQRLDLLMNALASNADVLEINSSVEPVARSIRRALPL